MHYKEIRHSFLPSATNSPPGFRTIFISFSANKNSASYYSLSRMLNPSDCLCAQGRHSYSLSLAFNPFRSSPRHPLAHSRMLGFHSTNITPAAHFVLLACSVAKSFTKGARCMATPRPKALHTALTPFVRVQTFHSVANGSLCLDFLLRSQPPALLSGGSGRLA